MRKVGRFAAFAVSAMLLSVISLLPLVSQAEEAARPKTTGYPAVEDVPPRPDKPAMTADEQSKLKKELSTARDRQEGRQETHQETHQAPKQIPKGKTGAGATQVKP
jgi:hypothetical protein